MTIYAQTNLQLYTQLRDLHYEQTNIASVAAAYSLASVLFTGLYRASGKSFIAHLVGTASILVSIQAPIELVTAALLHAAYTNGDFGLLQNRIDSHKHSILKDAVGVNAQELIQSYSVLDWSPRGLKKSIANFPNLPELVKNALVIRFANELEEYLDDGVHHCGPAKQDHLVDFYNNAHVDLLELATLLQIPEIGTALVQVKKQHAELRHQIYPDLSAQNETYKIISAEIICQGCFESSGGNSRGTSARGSP